MLLEEKILLEALLWLQLYPFLCSSGNFYFIQIFGGMGNDFWNCFMEYICHLLWQAFH